MSVSESTQFRTETGRVFPSVSFETLASVRSDATVQYGITPTQMVEGASYSMAMVVRYALGLSAHAGRVCGLVTDSIYGWVVLATLRHLANSGADAVIITAGTIESPSEEFTKQIAPLKTMNAEFHTWGSENQNDAMMDIVATCHNVLCGIYANEPKQSWFTKLLISALNESVVPIHTIECPIGVCPNTGKLVGEPLFASSTLSLGMVLSGLFEGSDYVGRHYLCDISLPAELYGRSGFEGEALFSEQPVFRVYPDRPEEPQEPLDIP